MANSNMKKKDVPRCLQKWYGCHFGCASSGYDMDSINDFLADYKR